jgi:peptide/nickel transport system substrate-binding protein
MQVLDHPTVNRAGNGNERNSMRKLRMAPWVALFVLVPLAVAGCGGGGKKGGTLTVLSQGDVDSLDPGYHYYQYDTEALDQTTQRTLYGWKPDGRTPTPDLAASMPTISDGGRTITIKLKTGIRFSPPVNRAATSGDVKYAIERTFLPQVSNPYSSVYYAEIVGSAAYAKGKAKEVTGIQAPDPQTLVIKTARPVGVLTTANALTEPGTAAVPKDYAQPFDKANPSTYKDHVVGTGPYMVPNDKTGKITSAGYQVGKKLVLVRNPNWDKSKDYRPAYVNRIEFLGGNDLTLASRRILRGDSLVSGDFAAPPVAVFKEALTRFPDQVNSTPGDSWRGVMLNTTVKPLDNMNVRKAIAAVIDRNALIATRGGIKVGEPAFHYIPPFMPGFADAGGRSSTLDFMKSPSGNLALAQQYMKKGGFPSGKYRGPSLLMVGDNAEPAKNTGEAVQSQLQQLGFKLTYRQVPHEVVNSKYCGVPKQKVAICPNFAWGKDFYDSQSELDPTFNGKNIIPAGNTNQSELNDPKLNAQMDKAELIPDPGARAKAWAAVDKAVTAAAVGVPWIWDNNINIRSKNVKGVPSLSNAAWDLTFTSIK